MGRFYTPGGRPQTIWIGQVSEYQKALDREERNWKWEHSWWAMAAIFYGGMAAASILVVSLILWITG